MATQGKGLKSYRRSDNQTDRLLGQTYKKLVFAHQFTSAGLTDIVLSSLNTPSDLIALGFANPSTAQLSSANLSFARENLKLISNIKGLLMDYVSYDVISDMTLRLKNGAESLVDEIIMGYIEPVVTNGVIGVDGTVVVETGTIAVGYTDFVVGQPFTYNKYPNEQVGDVLVFVDGMLQARCVGNLLSGEGNYIEVAPSSGNLSSTIRLKAAVIGSPVNVIVTSNGLVAERPSASVLSRVETLASTVDVLVDDVALALGNPTTRYQVAPSSVDQKNFGGIVYGFMSETVFNCVVGTTNQYTQNKCTHTSVQSAIEACPSGGSILVLNSQFTENLTINKNLMLVGKGFGSQINGTLTCQSGCDFSTIKNLRFLDNVTFQSGADGNYFRECFLASGKTVSDSGSGNSIQYIGE